MSTFCLYWIYKHIYIPANPQDKPDLSQMSSGKGEQTIVMEDLV